MIRNNLNVLFDLDGTLIDAREGILACLKHMLRSLEAPIPADSLLERYIGPPLQENVRHLLGPEDPEKLGTAISLYRDRFSSKGVYEAHVYPGIRDVLNDLRDQNAKLYIATTKPNLYAAPILEHFEISEFFVGVYGSELDGTRANKGDLIAHLLKEESIDAKNTCMIGDRSHDVVGALMNDVTPVGALWGYGSRDELLNAGATLLCESPLGLVEILASWRLGG